MTHGLFVGGAPELMAEPGLGQVVPCRQLARHRQGNWGGGPHLAGGIDQARAVAIEVGRREEPPLVDDLGDLIHDERDRFLMGKSKDDLQAVIAALKAADLGIPLQFNNFRD